MNNYCFGVDLGGTAIKFGIFSEDGECQEKWDIKTRKEDKGRYILQDIANEINKKKQQWKLYDTQVLGIGIGVPGPVSGDGCVFSCVNLGWGKTNVVEGLSKLTGECKIAVGNDANVAALGEMYQGGGVGHQSIIMITLGTGVGGGVVIDGKILAGSVGAAGELGHLHVNDDEEAVCTCGGKGCLEQYASATGIVRVAKSLMQKSKQETMLSKFDKLTAKDIFDCMKKGDDLANQAVDIMCEYLGKALGVAATVVDPEAFVIGGGVSKAGEVLTEKIQKSYEKRVLPVLKKKEFVLAKLGNDAGIYGAANMILSKK